ncbi:hypothetical protein LAV_00144 [Sphingobium phage Lacusarx]|uniref:Uncharacterized protein n=1 Tax=Sphingobium phage Lacusarx TaxID=1980139 RepID=A0A1W6DXA8_9CAUD|nr:hypothetical protein FDH44_gp159 [Sphingobium phage Lacusarx]ARK07519.1 hypothetical protein LAV_00144 [Sphingobium phage Lacusarx]
MKLLVYAALGRHEVSILVPKRRGVGFLKSPLGHHNGPLHSISYDIGFDIYGLDGSLDIQTGSLYRFDIPELLARIIPPIAAHYQMEWEQIGDEFWDLHPIGRNHDPA